MEALDTVTQLVAEGTVHADRCIAIAEPRLRGDRISSCTWINPDSPLIPVGTSMLHIETDATDALFGGYRAVLRTSSRVEPADQAGGATTEAVNTWEFPVTPQEWDSPDWSRSQGNVGWEPFGPLLSTLDGRIEYRIYATVQPTAPLNTTSGEWPLVLFDGEMEFRENLSTDALAYQIAAMPPLDQLVPVGTTQVVIGIHWSDVQGCLPSEHCYIRADTLWAGMPARPWSEPVDVDGDDHVVFVLEVGNVIEPDTPWASTSLVGFQPLLVADCAAASLVGPGCGGSPDRGARLRILVEAHAEPVDAEGFAASLIAAI